MGTFKSILVLIGLAAWANAYAASPIDFLRENGAPDSIVQAMLNGIEPVNKCLVSDNRLLCVRGRNYPGVSTNAQSRQAILNNQGISVRNDLFSTLADIVKSERLLNRPAVGEALAKTAQQDHIRFSGVQFITFSQGNWCAAAASIPLLEIKNELSDIYSQQAFIDGYCTALFPKAKEFMARGENSKALVALKELHDLKFANIDAYILAIRAFINNEQPKEAQKIALELLADFRDTMTVAQAEELGDIFLSLNMSKEVEAAYHIAISRL